MFRVLCFLLVALSAFGQKAPKAYPIERIEVRGNSGYTRQQIVAASGLRIGQVVTPEDMNAAVNRLTSTGAFEKVEFKFGPGPGAKGYVLTFTVDEAGPLFPVAFEDLGIADAAARDTLSRSDPLFGPRIPATKETLARYSKVLEERLAADGKLQKVAGRLAPQDSGELAVLFRPAVALPVVARVTFAGNQVLETAALANSINPTAIGMPYREPRFRQVLDTTVRPLYETRGRVRVAFPEIRTERDPSADGLLVTVKVDEGESYSLGAVEVKAPADSAALGKVAGLKTGSMFDGAEVLAAQDRIRARMRRDGYMSVKTRTDRRIDDAKKKVDLAISVEPGPQYRFGKLTIEGLDIVTEPVIRQMWGMKPGAPFNGEYPDRFLERVREEAVFDNLGDTKSSVKLNESARTVDVVLSFKAERPKKVVPDPDRR